VLNLWDTAGQENHTSMAAMYYRDAHAALLVYDTTVNESFQRVDHWLREMRAYEPNCVIYIVGNKIDLEQNRQFHGTAVEDYCKKKGCKHMEVSAKSNFNIKDVFHDIVKDIIEKNPSKQSKYGKDNKKQIFLTDEEHEDSKRRITLDNTKKKDIEEKKKCCGGG